MKTRKTYDPDLRFTRYIPQTFIGAGKERKKMNICDNKGSDRFRDDWRRARVQIIDHIRLSRCWSDVMLGVDTLISVSMKAKSLIAEQEMFENKNGMGETNERD